MRTLGGLAAPAAAVLALGLVLPAGATPPAQLGVARYVALGFDLGSGFVSETSVSADILPEERAALQRIRENLERWGKYQIVVRPGQAELLIAVRKGRLGSVGGSVRLGQPGSSRPIPVPGAGSGAGGELSSPQDMLEVFDANGVTLLWRGMKTNGLHGAGPPLFEAFQADVAKAEKATTKP